MARNSQRLNRVPEKALRSAFKNWQKSDWVQGYDKPC
jgi:hypothetical protein